MLYVYTGALILFFALFLTWAVVWGLSDICEHGDRYEHYKGGRRE